MQSNICNPILQSGVSMRYLDPMVAPNVAETYLQAEAHIDRWQCRKILMQNTSLR